MSSTENRKGSYPSRKAPVGKSPGRMQTAAGSASGRMRTASGSTPGRDTVSSGDAPAGREREEELRRRQRQQRRALQRERRARAVRRQRLLVGGVLIVVLLIGAGGAGLLYRAWAKSSLSEEVQGYRSQVEKYAKREKISEYVDTLLAIMMVESEGKGMDVMQSSESKGLESNSLGPEESIEQACVYFAALVEIAEDLKIKDDDALIQAYNYGPGYLYYVGENGKKHTQKLATAYAKEMSDGEKVRYLHLYAIKENGGWIYSFGNMFYAALVEQYL